MFQFITLTFNHQNYIIEHLESIKYQIEALGVSPAKLVICDDCSTDKTVELAHLWVEQNKEYFQSTKISKSIKNEGIVKNYLKAVQEIDTDHFKILAGDDVYYNNPILEVFNTYDFVVTPIITFTNRMDFGLDLKYSKARSTIKRVIKIMETDNPFAAPGIFMSRRIICDSLLNEHISMFKWIEDYPTWQFLFKLNQIKMKYISIDTPYILYRSNVGIYGSQGALSGKSNFFLEEENAMYNYYGIKKEIAKPSLSRYLNPINYIRKLEQILNLGSKQEEVYKDSAKKHYSFIKERAEEFLSKPEIVGLLQK